MYEYNQGDFDCYKVQNLIINKTFSVKQVDWRISGTGFRSNQSKKFPEQIWSDPRQNLYWQNVRKNLVT